MVNAVKSSVVTFTLNLSEAEATWLKGVVQNPLTEDPNDEDSIDANMRELFWNALNVPRVEFESLPEAVETQV